MIRKINILLFCLLIFSCKPKQQKTESGTDPHSYAEPENVIVKHLDLKLDVNFTLKTITGIATWSIENKNGYDEIVFDTKDLNISKIYLDNNVNEEAFFALGDKDNILGEALSVQIKPGTKTVTIEYTTSANAESLQWVAPQQTAGKHHPFLYTQSQAILARSWIPCQDSPSIRFTYNAEVKVPAEFLALMSAKNPQQLNKNGIYHFEQRHPIPSYLMALAVGNIAFQKISESSGVYAEPELLEKAAYEFADINKMIKAAEDLYGKYLWERYDILVLPPSFPFGGMENPMLTFVTPTVIAGDRSLVNLLAHELAHSWSGNLATNASWNDFWLNEGFTVYFERRIIEKIYGKDEAEMQEVLGFKDLTNGIAEFGKTHPDTRLKLDLADRSPDDAVTDIAYEKGYLFLKNIELTVGRDKFDAFLKKYFEKYAFKSVTLKDFERDLNADLIRDDESLKSSINAYGWIYQPGIPKTAQLPYSSRFDAIDKLKDKFIGTEDISHLEKNLQSTNEKLYFIRSLPDSISNNKLEKIDSIFHFTHSHNSEIQYAWYLLGLKRDYSPVYPQIDTFLNVVGRRKFMEPLYAQLLKTPKGTEIAKESYARNRRNYHSVSTRTIDKLFNGK
ncbi:M1 family metallopeptidase [Pseudopedobacter beijingensis]|uniref:Aminopeptidase N n=1 Tax=Pseudopedobacter beijingensis TaxID=1207056 RepID=A0ABW4ICH0_9SPHI